MNAKNTAALPSNDTDIGQEMTSSDHSSADDVTIEIQQLSLDLEAKTNLDTEDVTPLVENPEHAWFKDCPGSIDLDEKFSTMTGSYSEILDDQIADDDETLQKSVKVKSAAFSAKEDISPTEELTVVIPDHQDFFTDGPNSVPLYGMGPKNVLTISSAPASLRVYPDPPLVDPTVLADLENYARAIATSMDSLTENLTENLQGISALSVACLETYRDSVCKTCDAVDSNIKFMYQLMAKCEELSKAMKPMYKLQGEIKDIRRLLDMFESAVFSGGT